MAPIQTGSSWAAMASCTARRHTAGRTAAARCSRRPRRARPAEPIIWAFPAGGGLVYPSGRVIGGKGEPYGTDLNGGSKHLGDVYSLSPPASPGGAWGHTELWVFSRDEAAGGQSRGAGRGGSGRGAQRHGVFRRRRTQRCGLLPHAAQHSRRRLDGDDPLQFSGGHRVTSDGTVAGSWRGYFTARQFCLPPRRSKVEPYSPSRRLRPRATRGLKRLSGSSQTSRVRA